MVVRRRRRGGIETLNEKKRQQKLQVINQIFDIINKINDE
jgi:hypothetical protein